MAFVKKSQRGIVSAIRSFKGHLEGTEKSLHTVKNYLSDLATFEEFLKQEVSASVSGPAAPRRAFLVLESLTAGDLEKYGQWLQVQGLKNNSRRRKLLTVKRFLRYLEGRGRIQANLAPTVSAPWRVERIPAIPDYSELLLRIQAMPMGQVLLDRNRLLLWVLLESGAQISEVVEFRFSQIVQANDGQGNQSAFVEIFGKNARQISISEALYQEIQKFQIQWGSAREFLFSGFNRYGSISGAMTTRAAEIILKSIYLKWTRDGYFKEFQITPRSLRHAAVIYWYKQGMADFDVQKRLGLRTPYSLKLYHAYLGA